MALDRHVLDRELLELDDQARRQLIELAQRLLPYGDRLRALSSETECESAAARVSAPHTKVVTTALLDFFFQFIPSGDFDAYYDAVAAKGKAYQAAGFPYGSLISAAHFVEQVTLPVLGELYRDHGELERALMALDQLSDNAIVLIASAYFETTLRDLRALQQVTDSALSTLDLDQLLRSLLTRLLEALTADCGGVLLLDVATGELNLRASWDARNCAAVALDCGTAWEAGSNAFLQNHVVLIEDDAVPAGPFEPNPPAGASIGLPLKLGKNVIGSFYLHRDARQFDPHEAQLLELLAERCATAIEHAQLYERKAHLLVQTAALQRVTAGITTRTALPEILEAVIDGVMEVFGATRVAIYLRDKNSGDIDCPAARALDADFLAALLREYKGVKEGVLAQNGHTLRHFHVADARIDAEASLQSLFWAEGIRTVLVLPFGHEPEISGALCLFHDIVRHYQEEELSVAQTFADQAAIAIAHATLYREINERAADLDRMNRELQALDRMKADFSAMVSHELRTPLTAILGYTDLLLRGARGDLGERPSDDLKTIRANGHRLLTLINDLIDFSTLEAGRAATARRQVQLNSLLSHVVESFQTQAQARSITITTAAASDLPAVLGDADAVEKILGQLLSNAIKFTPRGGAVQVSAQESAKSVAQQGHGGAGDGGATGREPNRSWITLAVSDSGLGIAKDQLVRIWDHFYQVDSSSARRFGGTGLGLAIVKRLVEAQGGSVWAESEGVPGKGSTFSFCLPVVPGPEVAS